MAKKDSYDADSLVVLEFPDEVRKRPGMYIGGTTTEGMHHIYKEILDNSVDEAVAKYCTKIVVTNEGNGFLSVLDNGRGIPPGINKAQGVSGIELVFTVLHAGGKFNNDQKDSGYKTCFTGDTEIRLLDGTIRSFKWLAENYADKEFWVISCLPDGTIVPAKAVNPHKTKEVTELAVVTLDSGKQVRCTPDHRWMMRDGTYKEAKDLKINDSLMPFYHTRDEQGHLLFQPNNRSTQNFHDRQYIPLYREVYKHCHGEYEFGEHTHHIDFNAENDCPENLEKLTKGKHRSLHAKRNNEINGPDSLIRYNKSEKGKQKSKQNMEAVISSGQHFSQTKENKKIRSKQFKEANRSDMKTLQQKGKFQRAYLYITEKLNLEFNETTYEEYKQWGASGFVHFEDLFPGGTEGLKESIPDYLKRKKRAGVSKQKILDDYKPVDKEKLLKNTNNHKVTNIEIITLEKPEPVYDIQVPGTNNFVLGVDTFCHNSGGLHGVGASVTNAVSEELQVFVKRGKKIWTQDFKRGIKVNDVALTKNCDVEWNGDSGTFVKFKPDNKIFKHIDIEWEFSRIKKRCREIAFLVPGLEIVIQGFKGEDEEDVTFKFDNGLQDYVAYQMKGKAYLVEKIDLNIDLPELGCSAQAVFTYETEYDEHLISFANNIPTHEGGVHLNAFLNALLKVVIDIGEREKITKGFAGKVNKSDIREGLNGVLSIRLQQPEFEGQTKTKLGNPEIRQPLEEQFYDSLKKMFDKKRKEDGKEIANKILLAVMAREHARRAKDLTRKKGGLEHFTLKGKLADCESKDPEECELFLVEGDCFHKDTPIVTDKGIKKITEIKDGDMIYTHNHRYRKATVRKPKVKKKKCKITIQGKTFICSEDHLWLVMRCDSEIAEWVPAKDLQKDDLLVKTIH